MWRQTNTDCCGLVLTDGVDDKNWRSAVVVRQRTLERQQEKEAKLDAFLETTRARVGEVKSPSARAMASKTKVPAVTSDEEAAAMDEKTRRRLTQSLSLLLPRASTSSLARSKRVRAWEGHAARSKGAGLEEESLLAAADIAASLGEAVRTHARTWHEHQTWCSGIYNWTQTLYETRRTSCSPSIRTAR
jgi:hypothetical protein